MTAGHTVKNSILNYKFLPCYSIAFFKTFISFTKLSPLSTGYSTPEVALASQPSVVPSLPSVLDLAGYSSEQSLPQSLHGHGPSPFIVGPGYAPISAKIVNAIVSGKYINLGDLLPENALVVDDFSEPQLLLDGRLVLTGSARKPRKEITDILSWVEAFTVFSVIVCSYFPNRWRDLSSYKLLILRTYRQFAGYAWCDYDKAFRQHAAATRLLDWLELNVQLFHVRDILADDSGKWVNNGQHKFPKTVRGDSFIDEDVGDEFYTLHRHYYYNKDSRDFHETITFVTGAFAMTFIFVI